MRLIIGWAMFVIPIIAFIILIILSFGTKAIWFGLVVFAIIIWFAIAETLITG